MQFLYKYYNIVWAGKLTTNGITVDGYTDAFYLFIWSFNFKRQTEFTELNFPKANVLCSNQFHVAVNFYNKNESLLLVMFIFYYRHVLCVTSGIRAAINRELLFVSNKFPFYGKLNQVEILLFGLESVKFARTITFFIALPTICTSVQKWRPLKGWKNGAEPISQKIFYRCSWNLEVSRKYFWKIQENLKGLFTNDTFSSIFLTHSDPHSPSLMKTRLKYDSNFDGPSFLPDSLDCKQRKNKIQ